MIAVTKISSLIGKHPYKQVSDTVKEILTKAAFWKKNPKHSRVCRETSAVEAQLKQTSFYNWFTRANVITGRMRKIGRSIVNKVCREHGVKYNKPYNYWAKARGVTKEPWCVEKIRRMCKAPVTNCQKKISLDCETYKIVGAIDGICQDKVVEVKCRSCVLKETPGWELIQLTVYCYILQLPGVLYEFQGNDVKKTEISLEQVTESFENEIRPELTKVINEQLLLSKKS